MSAEKTFVIKEVFSEFNNLETKKTIYGTKHNFFNVPWKIRLQKTDSAHFEVHFECVKSLRGQGNWGVELLLQAKAQTKKGEKKFQISRDFSQINCSSERIFNQDDFQIQGRDLTVECHVAIQKIWGVKKNLRNFNVPELSDVILKIGGEKFFVSKLFLASHSTYFKTLLLGDFIESKSVEIELKDINSCDFQNFQEVLNEELSIDEDTVYGILHLAHFYDAKTALKQCEKYLIRDSKHVPELKSEWAVQYGLETLKKKIMSTFKYVEDIRRFWPDDFSQLDQATLAELLELSIDLPKRNSCF